MITKQIYLDDAKSDLLTAEWEEDFTSLRLFRNGQKVGDFLNKEDLQIGKSFKIEKKLIFVTLKKTLFSEPKIQFLINGKDYDQLNNIYSDKLSSLSITYHILAALSIFNFFNFYSIGVYSIVSGLIYSGLGYLYFVERKLKAGFLIAVLLFLDITFNFISKTGKIELFHLPKEISMRLTMLLIIITSIIYVLKERKTKNAYLQSL